MKKILLIAIAVFTTITGFSQDDTSYTRLTPRNNAVNLAGRSNDHLLIQLGYHGWNGKPDSFNTKGLPRTFNIYFMFDFPFKSNPKFSAAIGAGIASDNMFFDAMEVDITGTTDELQFRNLADTNHYRKYKLNTAWLEAPVELRFSSNPGMSGKSVKFAVGAKVGLLLNAKTKGKTLVNSDDDPINAHTMKLASKRYFNTTRLSATARLGYGHFSLFYSYAITPLFKEGVTSEIRPYAIGLTLSGL